MSVHQKLRELFLLDQQVRGMEGRLNVASARLKAQQTKLDRLNRQCEELTAQVRQEKAKAADLESQSKAQEERVDQLREQMNTIKSNKEYSALLLEVNTLKTDKSSIEDEALEHMGRVDLLSQDLTDVKAKIEDQQKLVKVAEADLEESRAQVGDELEQLQAKRNEAEQQVPEEARQTFRRQAHDHDGEALAVVVLQNRRRMEYTCGGCHMSIPAERVNSLMSTNEQISCCPTCGRILYLEEHAKAST